ncbi:IMC sub-compartment protein ISP3 [Babesia caballi]|uniref:IMC sub-compartment protein ISP3 n=1 Tax=Babesia caballi TaxID=5871 RepID=A0AAV4LUP6_BABCB|nr:IMC sub-compartment protein ISP3 [Babesia caballi]
MGNQPSTACCYGPNGASLMSARDAPLKPEEEATFMNTVVNGCETEIVFADGNSMPCSVVYDLAEDCLHLVVDEKRRVIALGDVEEILGANSVAGLSSADQPLIMDPHIVAFRLTSTKKAILLRFKDVNASKGFYHFLKEIIRENAEKSQEAGSAPESAESEEEAQQPSHTVIF